MHFSTSSSLRKLGMEINIYLKKATAYSLVRVRLHAICDIPIRADNLKSLIFDLRPRLINGRTLNRRV